MGWDTPRTACNRSLTDFPVLGAVSFRMARNARTAPQAATQEDGQGLPPAWKGWVLAVALGLSGVSIPLMMHHHNWCA